MAVKTATEAMRRKAGAGRPAPEIGRMTEVRAWRVAMPRAAENVLGVQATLLKVDEVRLVRDKLAELVTEHALITLLEGPEQRFGVAIMEAGILAALIEAATTGRIASRPPIPREPTRTDAMISADLLDALLDGFESNLSEMEDPPNLGGYRYAAPMVDARAMTMSLAEGPYSVFRLLVELGGGIRQGEIVLAFPVAPRGSALRQDVAAFQQAFADNVMEAPAELDAALYRLRLPLSAITGLQPNDVLRVPLAALAAVEVEAIGGPKVARARLGQQGGFRAVRITHLAGAAEDEPELNDFEDAAPAASRAALPAAGFGASDDGFPAMDDLPPLGGEASAEDGPGFDLPDLEGLGEGDLPLLGGDEEGDLPDLSTDDEDEPSLPPLSG